MKANIVPFFVADRPASFTLLKGILLKYPKVKVGIMTNAFTSTNLWQIFRKFPYELPIVYGDESLLPNEDLLYSSLVKMTDSGVFSRNGCTIDYEELFDRYNYMGTDYGIMIDILRDSRATLSSAERALRVYEKHKKKYNFKLIAVAQGNNLEEYMSCFEKLSRNFEHTAIGGLLKKRENSARYVRVRDEGFMFEIIRSIRREFNPRWLFALGCYHPSRHSALQELGVWGSDYKGWIFNYKPKRLLLNKLNTSLSDIELKFGLRDVLEQLDRVNKIESSLLDIEKEWRTEKNNAYKKALWTKMNRLKSQLWAENKHLCGLRVQLMQFDHLSSEYKQLVETYRKLVEKDERILRFQQVRTYIEDQVYGQLTALP